MKKTKHLLIVLVLVLISALALSVVAACKDKTEEPSGEKTETLQSIELDTSKVKTSFNVGDAFSSDGLVVYANITVTDEKGTDTAEKRDITSLANVVSTAYKSDTAGTYKITVSYVLNNIYKEAEYNVTVEEVRYGVDVILQEGVLDGIELSEDKSSGEIALDANKTAVTIDPTKIEVRVPDSKGVIDYSSAPLSASDYTVKVYKNAETEITEFTNLGKGSYEIWVSLDGEDADFVRKSFVQVFVIDNLVSLTFNENADGTLLTQQSGDDKISSTWKFTATYATGATEQVSFADFVDEKGESAVLGTATAGEKTANINYVKILENGAKVIKNVEIDYVITAAAGTTVFGIDFGDKDKFEEKDVAGTTITEAVAITDKNGAETGFKLTKSSSSKGDANKIRTADNTQVLQLQGSAKTTQNSLVFTVGAGKTTITVKYFQNAGRYIDLLNASGEVIADSSAKPTVDAKFANAVEYTFSVKFETETTLYLGSHSSGMYISSISVTTVAPTVMSIDFTDSEKFETGTTVGEAGVENTEIKYIDGTGTGFYVDSAKLVKIDTQNKMLVLKLDGSGSGGNTVNVTVPAGKITIEVSYFNSNAGRFVKVLNDGLDTTAPDVTELTTTDKAVKKRVISIILDKSTVLELGSDFSNTVDGAKSGGIFVTSIKVTVL